MIISRAGNGRTIYATHWAPDFASYANAGGWIIARTRDGASIYVQPGDEAASFESSMDSAESAALAKLAPDADSDEQDEARGEAWDSVMGELFAAQEGEWLAPSDAGGAPSSDGGFWGFYA